LNPVTRSPNSAKADRERSDAQARALAEAQRLADIREQRVNRLVTGLQQGLSGSTAVSVPGTGGPTYASYTSFVDLVYRSAWAPLKPRELSERSASVLVRVIIARDGTVLSSQIRRRSGHAALDSSVRTVLDRVRTIGRPFPEGARDTQREFEIEFNLQTAVGPG
jgi:TonB family protein